VSVIACNTANAAIPQTIPYQGRLTDAAGNPVADGLHTIKFSIVTGPTTFDFVLWSSGDQSVMTQDGLFSYVLGSNVPFPSDLFSNPSFEDSLRYLSVKVGTEQILPITRLESTPFSHVAGAVPDNSISSNNIVDFTIINNDIADDAVETIVVQDNSLQAVDIFDEAGIASSNSGASVTLGGGGTDIATVTITTPAPGYIFLTAKAYVLLKGTKLANYANLKITETSGDGNLTSQSVRVGNDAFPSTGQFRWPLAVQRVFFKNAGTHTFYLTGVHGTTNGTAITIFPVLTAIYISTSYGSVQTVSQNPGDNPDAKATTITDESGAAIGNGWDVDLRYYELRAREANIKALNAAKMLRKAQSLKLSKRQ